MFPSERLRCEVVGFVTRGKRSGRTYPHTKGQDKHLPFMMFVEVFLLFQDAFSSLDFVGSSDAMVVEPVNH